MMLWCDKCHIYSETEPVSSSGDSRCTVCANILFASTSNKYETPADSHLVDKDFYYRSNQLALNFINNLALKLGIFDAFAVQQARKYYQIAGERNFINADGTGKIAASCLYIACLVNKIPILLVSFSMVLCVNVYELGVVYLQLCQFLGLEMHSFAQKLIDPSLFIHRYASALLKKINLKVSMVALRIIAGIKRDWLQSGRNVSGLCGAAVYIAALANGFSCKKSDIEKAVCICESELSKRLIEFGKAESRSLTVNEFSRIAKEFKEDKGLKFQDFGENLDVLCQHKVEKPYFYGLCNSCYKEFVELARGLRSGSDPPSFDRAETEALIREFNNDKCGLSKKFSSVSNSVSDETGDLSDVEVDEYLNNDKESELMKVLWEVKNKEYIREQVLKKSGAAAGEARENPRKKQIQKQATKVKNAPPSPTAAEATHQVLSKKRLSSFINFDALRDLFGDDAVPYAKKNHTESYHDTDAWEQE